MIEYKHYNVQPIGIKNYPFYRFNFYRKDGSYITSLDSNHLSQDMVNDILSGDELKFQDALEIYQANILFHLELLGLR